jgi:hypothetical protein
LQKLSRREAKRRLGKLIASQLQIDDELVADRVGIPPAKIAAIREGKGRFKRNEIRVLLIVAQLGHEVVAAYIRLIFGQQIHDRGRRWSKNTRSGDFL